MEATMETSKEPFCRACLDASFNRHLVLAIYHAGEEGFCGQHYAMEYDDGNTAEIQRETMMEMLERSREDDTLKVLK